MNNLLNISPLKPFRFWCQKVLPIVYDDSLSYYELLCKVVDYLNRVIADTNGVIKIVDELTESVNTLKTFIEAYFENLNIQEEINNKLDEMAESGQLDSLLENLLLNNYANFGENFDYTAYKDMILTTIMSYLKNSVNNPCLDWTGERTYPSDIPFVPWYRDGNTYMGVLGQGSFDYDDTIYMADDDRPILYIDCSGFVSLVLKGLNYEDSVYFEAFQNVNNPEYIPSPRKCQATGDKPFEKRYTMDFCNQITTYYMAQICDSMGFPLREVMRCKNSNLVINDNISNLRTGDIIFFGDDTAYHNDPSMSGRYKGIHHCAIYIKTLDDLNYYLPSYVRVKYLEADETYKDEPQYGYIAHVDTYKQDEGACIKIQTLSQRLYYNDNRTETAYYSRPLPTIGTSNKCSYQIMHIFGYYRDIAMCTMGTASYEDCINNYPPNCATFSISTGNVLGALDLNYLTAKRGVITRNLALGRGYAIDENENVDNLVDGLYYCDTAPIARSLTNAPWETPFILLKYGSYAEDTDRARYGVMIAYTYNASQTMQMAYRIRSGAVSQSEGGVWGDWIYVNDHTTTRIRNGDTLDELNPGLYYITSEDVLSDTSGKLPWDTGSIMFEYKGSEGRSLSQLPEYYNQKGFMIAYRYSNDSNDIAFRFKKYYDPNPDDPQGQPNSWSEWRYLAEVGDITYPVELTASDNIDTKRIGTYIIGTGTITNIGGDKPWTSGAVLLECKGAQKHNTPTGYIRGFQIAYRYLSSSTNNIAYRFMRWDGASEQGWSPWRYLQDVVNEP